MATEPHEEAPAPSAHSTSYRIYVLLVLTFSYVLNYADRTVLAIVQQPLQKEFGLSDTHIGLLSGTAFALLYVTLGVPIARLAERRNRAKIIAASVGVWSLMTILCGMASNMIVLTLARIGVGFGEAGATPPSHSLISNYFPERQRAAALGTYALGLPIGLMLTALFGGWLAENHGWRAAFIVLGVPGIPLAVLIFLTVRDPRSAAPSGQPADADTLWSAAKRLFGNGAYRHTVIASTIAAGAWASLTQFTTTFFMRTHGLTLGEASTIFGLANGIAAGLGVLGGGLVATHLHTRNAAAPALISSAGAVLAFVTLLLVYSVPGVWLSAIFFTIAAFAQGLYYAPSYSVLQRTADDRSRATAMALYLLTTITIGIGLVPLAAGLISDFVARNAALGETAEIASARGLQTALFIMSSLYIWSAAHFFYSGRFLRHRDQAAAVTVAEGGDFDRA